MLEKNLKNRKIMIIISICLISVIMIIWFVARIICRQEKQEKNENIKLHIESSEQVTSLYEDTIIIDNETETVPVKDDIEQRGDIISESEGENIKENEEDTSLDIIVNNEDTYFESIIGEQSTTKGNEMETTVIEEIIKPSVPKEYYLNDVFWYEEFILAAKNESNIYYKGQQIYGYSDEGDFYGELFSKERNIIEPKGMVIQSFDKDGNTLIKGDDGNIYGLVSNYVWSADEGEIKVEIVYYTWENLGTYNDKLMVYNYANYSHDLTWAKWDIYDGKNTFRVMLDNSEGAVWLGFFGMMVGEGEVNMTADIGTKYFDNYIYSTNEYELAEQEGDIFLYEVRDNDIEEKVFFQRFYYDQYIENMVEYGYPQKVAEDFMDYAIENYKSIGEGNSIWVEGIYVE